MTNAEKLTLAKHACHIRMGVIEGTHSAKCGQDVYKRQVFIMVINVLLNAVLKGGNKDEK